MNPDQHTININEVDATRTKRERVIHLLDTLGSDRNVPKAVQLEAEKRRLTVLATYRVEDNEQWIKTQWSRYITKGSIEAVMGVLLVVVILTHTWPLLMFPAVLVAAYGTWMGTRAARRRSVLRSGRLPKP